MVPLSDFSYGDLMPVDDFIHHCKEGMFIDYDGFGYGVYGDKVANRTPIYPSERDTIPALVTHILWFNK